ncbi:hypothetical protein ACJRO7_016624 [Eucalyptus globulus]|uniref:Uncharacterized protein n=1 Tax=Eucalyptus globulus TaxID=34317 RepID=A0ABD3LB87_EUCGL
MRPSSVVSLLLFFLVILRLQVEAGRVGEFIFCKDRLCSEKLADIQNSKGIYLDYAPSRAVPSHNDEFDTLDSERIHLNYAPSHAAPPVNDEFDTQDSEGIHLDYPPAHASPPRCSDGCGTQELEGNH